MFVPEMAGNLIVFAMKFGFLSHARPFMYKHPLGSSTALGVPGDVEAIQW